MTVPYYIPIFPAPVAWTNGTNGPAKSEVVLITAKDQQELQALKGTLKDKIVLMPSVMEYQISFEPMGTPPYRRIPETNGGIPDYQSASPTATCCPSGGRK